MIPHRGLEASKTRLAPVLEAEEREALAARLLARVLKMARLVADDVVVITPSTSLAGIVTEAGARLEVQRGMSLNEGLEEARQDAIGAGVETLLVLHGDLPNLRAEEIRQLLTACPAPRGVAIAPTGGRPGRTGSAEAAGRHRLRVRHRVVRPSSLRGRCSRPAGGGRAGSRPGLRP